MDVRLVNEKIIRYLKEKGPSLPITLSRVLQINSLFISAFLSELAQDKKIKVSYLKVGGSPLYFIEGQESLLDQFYSYLHPREADAYILLKKQRILKNDEQEPAIRVALQSIHDFAVSFNRNNELYWKYYSVTDDEINNYFNKTITNNDISPAAEIIKKNIITVSQSSVKEEDQETDKRKDKTLLQIKKVIHKQKESLNLALKNPLVLPKKIKPKSSFVLRVISNLEKNGFEIIEERNHKAKEFICVISVSSDLGPLKFLTFAKEKKIISESDLRQFLSTAQSIPFFGLFMFSGKLNKKAVEFADAFSHVLKVRKIE